MIARPSCSEQGVRTIYLEDNEVNISQPLDIQDAVSAEIERDLHAQREGYLKEGSVTPETRIDRIDRCIDMLVKYAEPLQEALN